MSEIILISDKFHRLFYSCIIKAAVNTYLLITIHSSLLRTTLLTNCPVNELQAISVQLSVKSINEKCFVMTVAFLFAVYKLRCWWSRWGVYPWETQTYHQTNVRNIPHRHFSWWGFLLVGYPRYPWPNFDTLGSVTALASDTLSQSRPDVGHLG